MKELFLLRHAKSSWADPGMADDDRPLNKRGRQAAAAMAGYLSAEGLRPGLILCSSARRTRETLDFISEALGSSIPVHIEPELYLADPATLLERLRHVPDTAGSVLIIGHNPGLHELAAELTAGIRANADAQRLRDKFPTAAFARFRLKLDRWRDLSDERLAGARLLGYVIPADLAEGE
jgi:phosphohistidine phosphatase